MTEEPASAAFLPAAGRHPNMGIIGPERILRNATKGGENMAKGKSMQKEKKKPKQKKK